MLRISVRLAVFCLLSTYCLAQVHVAEDQPASQTASEGHELLEENNFFRISRWEVAAGQTASVVNKRDLVVVAQSEVEAKIKRPPEATTLMSQGEVRFVPRGEQLTIENPYTESAKILVAVLKNHWDAEIRECTEPKKCSHPIRTGPLEVGESTLLFTNGFLTAYRYRLDRGGTLDTSYYSSRAKDHLVLFALTDLDASFDGQEEQLKAGQVYATGAGQVEVNAVSSEARWVVLRMDVPTHAN